MSLLIINDSSLCQAVPSLLANSLSKATAMAAASAIGQKALYMAGEWVGKKIYALTGGRVTLSTIIPETIKAPCRELGDFLLRRVIAPINDHVPSVEIVTRHIPSSAYFPVFLTTVVCPVVEEAVYRLPLTLLFSQIDNVESFVPGLSSAGTAIKLASSIFSAIAFTYGHERSSGVCPHNPGRAAGLFASGIGYAIVATQLDVQTAIFAHSVYNLSSYLPY